MHNMKFRRILSALLLVSMIFGFGGCRKKPAPISGGKVDGTDTNAPKVIESKELTDFAAAFYLRDRLSAADSGTFRFEVRPDESGKLILREDFSGASIEANASLLDDIIAIIDENDLVFMNGVSRYTAGLDPDIALCELTANYASGEKLHFRIDNDWTAKWDEQLCDLFASRFEAAGVKLLAP